MNLVKALLTKNACYQRGRTITVKGLMLHSVGCPRADALKFVQDWDNPNLNPKKCVHAFIDANTGTVYQTLPWNYRGWHAGKSGGNDR